MAKTFLPAFEALKTAAPDAADVLCLLAFLAPDDIPIRLLLDANVRVPDLLGTVPGDPLTLNRAVGRLNQYSLLRRVTGDSLGVHRLVQTVLRAHLAGARPRWAEAAVRLLASDFPLHGGDRTTWPHSARLLPHVITATRQAEQEGASPAATIELLTRAGSYLRHRYDFPNARDLLVRAGRLAELTYQPALSSLADTLEQVALVFSNQRNLAEAQVHFERAVLIGQAAWGKEDERVGRLQERLGFEVLRPLGDLEAAKRMLERAHRIYEKRHGRNHVWIAYVSSKLGFVLWDLQDLPRAHTAFERALRIFRTAEGYGPEHPEVARALTGLGQVLVDRNELCAAQGCQESALKIFQKSFGPSDLEVARTLDKLGYVTRKQGSFEAARNYHVQALDLFRSVFEDDNHPDVAFVFTNLGLVFRDLGDSATAREHHERSLSIFHRFGDKRHCEIVRARLSELPV